MNDDTYEDPAALYSTLLAERRLDELRERFFEHEGKRIYNFILLRLWRDKDLAQDTYQEFAVAFIESLDRCRDGSSLESFAFTIARRCANRAFTARNARAKREGELDSFSPALQDAIGVYGAQRFPVPGRLDSKKRQILRTATPSFLKTEFRDDYEEVVAQLSPKDQELWWLRWAHKLGRERADYRTIALAFAEPGVTLEHEALEKAAVTLKTRHYVLKKRVNARVASLREKRRVASLQDDGREGER